MAFIVAAVVALAIAGGLAAVVLGEAEPDLGTSRALWCWLFAGLAFAYLVLAARLFHSFTRPHLWLVALTLPLFVALVAVFIYAVLPDNKRAALKALSQEQIVVLGMTGAAVLQFLAWLLLYPAVAAARLLRSPSGAEGMSFADTMRDASRAGSRLYGPAGHRQSQLLEIAALLLAAAAFLVVNWFAWHRSDVFLFMVATLIALVAVVAAYPLWRRFRAARSEEAAPQQPNDTRPPILFLRALEDNEPAADTSPPTAARRLQAAALPGLRRPTAGSARLESAMARELGRRGPFLAIGAPDEPLPQLGTTRPGGGGDTWKSSLQRWSDTAQMIVAVASARMWARWELDRLIERRHLDKVVLVMPALPPDDRRARWDNIVAKLASTPWAPALSQVPADRLIALRFRPGGRVSVATGTRRWGLHYLLAMRLLTA